MFLIKNISFLKLLIITCFLFLTNFCSNGFETRSHRRRDTHASPEQSSIDGSDDQVSNVPYKGMDGALKYLEKYGYLDDYEISSPESMSLRDVRDFIKDFQTQMSLNVTGMLDSTTLRLMNTQRCSNKDEIKVHHQTSSFQKLHLKNIQLEKFTLYDTKWKKNTLTYRITKFSYQRISKDFTRSKIAEAFQTWERYVPLRFQEDISSPEVDLEVKFTYGHHGDSFTFFGTSQLAHAFYPGGKGLPGDIHFNDEVKWAEGNLLFYTALHEIGHSLGLRHSSHQDSIMYSHLNKDITKPIKLHQDDIDGIQTIYGIRSTHNGNPFDFPKATEHLPEEPKPKPYSLRNHPICYDGQFDAVLEMERNNEILFFRGPEIVTVRKVNNILSVHGKPRLISEVFSGRLPSHLDAAFNLGNKTYFFKGDLYWRSSSFSVDDGYPKVISKNFPGIPNNIDAVFAKSPYYIYFFKGSHFWKFYKRNLTSTKHEIGQHWNGIPYDGIRGALNMNSNTYFFRAGRYWKINVLGYDVPHNPQYPRDARIWWFSCTELQTPIRDL